MIVKAIHAMNNVKCTLCNSYSKFLFKKKLLSKHKVTFFKCSNCEVIFSEKPYWLDEAYHKPISVSDVGILKRNNLLAKAVDLVITLGLFNKRSKYLDYGGGYGLLVRLLRDRKYDFYRQDKYCENIFARYFDLYDIPMNKRKFELVTAFELLEHLTDPNKEFKKVFSYSDSTLFSTLLYNTSILKHIDDWWYLAPETGQHIIFYNIKSLNYIAIKYNMHLYSDNAGLHLFTKREFFINPFLIIKPLLSIYDYLSNTTEGVQKDFIYTKNKIKKI